MAGNLDLEGYMPPSESESLCYLDGLGGNPRLIARTSTDVFVDYDFDRKTMRLDTLGRDNVLTQHFLGVQDSIVRELQGLSEPVLVRTHQPPNVPAATRSASPTRQFEWTAILPLRLGERNNLAYIEDTTHYPTVLMITVERSSAYSCSWAVAMRKALACRALLRRAHASLRSVEVIVAAIAVESQSRAAAFLHEQMDWKMDSTVHSALMPLLPYSGCAIAQQKSSLAGALGPVIRLSRKPASGPSTSSPTTIVCGLTSRHVAVGPLLVDHLSYNVDDKNSKNTLDARVLTADAVTAYCPWNLLQCEYNSKSLMAELWSRLHQDHAGEDETAANDLLSCQATLKYIKTLQDAMYDDRATAPEAREVGRVLYTPTFALGRHRQLRDWALFSLPRSQNGAYTSVHIDRAGETQVRTWVRFVTATTPGAPRPVDDDDDEWKPIFNLSPTRMLQLHGRGMPAAPPFKTSSAPSSHPSSFTSTSSKYPYFLVAKRGPTTGLTFGVVNELGAVRRIPYSTGNSLISCHMIVLPIRGSPAFSAKGDSGAAIFDPNGCIVGIVDAGSKVSMEGSRWQPPRTPPPPAQKENVVPGEPSSSSSAHRIPQRQPRSGTETNLPGSATASIRIQPATNTAMDVTFGTPIQWLLEDIRSFTGCDADIV